MKKLLVAIAIMAICCSCGSARKAAHFTDEDRAIDLGYGVIDKDQNTYSVSRVKTREREVISYNSIFDYIRGRVPGVLVTSDNRIIVRGIGTNSGNTDPLFIVDGMTMSPNDVANIDPNVVDYVEVLKDGSSSIYGVQGANGVVIITTKR